MTLPATLDALEARAKADAESGWLHGNEVLVLIAALRFAVDELPVAGRWAESRNRILAILAGVRGA